MFEDFNQGSQRLRRPKSRSFRQSLMGTVFGFVLAIAVAASFAAATAQDGPAVGALAPDGAHTHPAIEAKIDAEIASTRAYIDEQIAAIKLEQDAISAEIATVQDQSAEIATLEAKVDSLDTFIQGMIALFSSYTSPTTTQAPATTAPPTTTQAPIETTVPTTTVTPPTTVSPTTTAPLGQICGVDTYPCTDPIPTPTTTTSEF